MKKYLISIKSESGNKLYTSISGDSFRSFAVGSFDTHNLWDYKTPWTAARRLEQIARGWECRGFPVSYGYAEDTEKHDPGTILTSWSGQKIRIDFECSEKPCF